VERVRNLIASKRAGKNEGRLRKRARGTLPLFPSSLVIISLALHYLNTWNRLSVSLRQKLLLFIKEYYTSLCKTCHLTVRGATWAFASKHEGALHMQKRRGMYHTLSTPPHFPVKFASVTLNLDAKLCTPSKISYCKSEIF